VHVQNKDVTEAIQKVAAAYDCKIAEGVLSHQMKQFVIDANKVILSVTNPETRVDDAEFEENEVYAIDIVTSTGDGKVCVLQICAHICVCGYGVWSSMSGVYLSSMIVT
jgi:methionine aminopeptidase